MANFTVNSNGDNENPDDGLLTLREAIAAAADTAEADTIVFAGAISTVALEEFLTIADGQDLVIDGDRDGDGVADVRLNGGNATYHFLVEAGATLALDTLALVNGSGTTAGAINNRGDTTLIRTLIDDTRAEAAGVADGGDGGRGAAGSQATVFASATPGGPGSEGADGADGNAAAGAVFNRADAELVLIDSAVGPNVVGIADDGGDGGDGGPGGTGGAAGGFRSAASGGPGGDGGDGGNSGIGSNGIVNLGDVIVETAFAVAATEESPASPGRGGAGGAGGAAGSGGGGSAGASGEDGDDGAVRGFDTRLASEGTVENGDDVYAALVFLNPAPQVPTAEGQVAFTVVRLGAEGVVTGELVLTDTASGSVVASREVNLGASETATTEIFELGDTQPGTVCARLLDLDGEDVGLGTDTAQGGLTVEQARVVAYLYEAGLDRDGNIDFEGLNFWIDIREQGFDELEVAQFFLESDEFENRNGDPFDIDDPRYLDDDAYVVALYNNVLDRDPDQAGFDFWSGVLASLGNDRARLLLEFAISEENREGSPEVETLEPSGPGQWDFSG
ncbi:MAG: DUF4214 domain-containing protein [Paracoccaceae bacterium]